MRLVLVSPAWRRYEVTRLALAQRAHLVGVLAERGIDARVLVVADDKNLDVASEFGFDTLECPNVVGQRFNDGLEHACRDLDADYVSVVGSDDWVHEDLFDRLPADVTEMPQVSPDRPVVFWDPTAPEAITGRELALVDLSTGTLRRCHARLTRRTAGVIPWVFPRVALEPSGFRPVADHLMRGLDGSMAAGLGVSPEWVFHDPHDLCRVDFKSAVNLNSFDAITAAIGYGDVETDPWTLLAERYPAHLVEQARRLSSEMRSDPLAVAA